VNQGHDEFREWAGAYALGALDPDDRHVFERHLAECSRCAHEVSEFAPITGLLSTIGEEDLVDLTSVDNAGVIAARVRHDEIELRASRNRWRHGAIAGAAAAVLVLAGVLVVGARSSDSPTAPTVAAVVTSTTAESTAVFTSARGWGTEISIELEGLPRRERYQLWAVDQAGTWSAAATWGPTPSGGAAVVGATSLATDTLDRVAVTSQDRDDVLIDASV
jgi:anti-sigma-K factor RskA